MKQRIKKWLAGWGYDVVEYDPIQKEIQKNNRRWLQALDIRTVIDAGGGDGIFAKRIRETLPAARVISFEALAPSYERLNERMKGDTNFESHLLALNNRSGKSTFRMSSNEGSSSLLPMSELHKQAYPESKDITELKVDCKRLDDVIDEKKLDKKILFKLDVQGAEKLVLEGGENVLQRTELVFCEVNFQELYHGCVLFNDLTQFLAQRGFRVIGVENVSQNPKNGLFLQADAWFQRI